MLFTPSIILATSLADWCNEWAQHHETIALLTYGESTQRQKSIERLKIETAMAKDAGSYGGHMLVIYFACY